MAFASVLRATPRLAVRAAPQIARTSARRGYASGPGQAKKNNGLLFGALGAAAVGGGLYFYTRAGSDDPRAIHDAASPKEVDYQAVYNAIAESLEDEKYDGESMIAKSHLVGAKLILSRSARRRLVRPCPCSSRLARVRHLRQELWVRYHRCTF